MHINNLLVLLLRFGTGQVVYIYAIENRHFCKLPQDDDDDGMEVSRDLDSIKTNTDKARLGNILVF